MQMIKLSEKGNYLIKESVVFLTLALLILVIGYTHALIEYRILVFAALFWTMVAGAWLISGYRITLPFKIPVLIWVGVYLLSAFNSIDPRRSLSQFLIMTTSLFLFYLAFDLVKKGWPVDLFSKGFIFVGSIITVAGLYNAFSWYQNWLAINPGVWIPFITYRPATANVLAPILNLTAILGIVFFYRTKGVGKKIFFAIITLAALFMLFLTSSRGGWLGAGAGLGFVMVMIGYLEKNKLVDIFIKIKANKVLFGFLIISLLIAIGIAGYILYNQAIHPTHGSIFNSRAVFWKTAWKVFIENPIVGQGPFTYGSAFLANQSVPPDQLWIHAHSSFMNLLAEMGILGVMALAYLAYSFLRKFVKNFFVAIQQNLLMLPTTAFLLAYLVHSFFDSLHMEPALIWSLAIFLGASYAEKPDEKKQQTDQKTKRPWWVLILIAFVWFGIWTITPYYQAVELANQNQWQQAYQKFEQAVQRDPWNGLAHQQLALSAAVLAQQGDPSKLDVAIKALETTIQHEPSWALNHANLSALYLAKDDLQNAVSSAQEAVDLAPRAPLYQFNLGYLAELAGEEEQANQSYQQALNLNPGWATASFWEETLLRTAIRDDWKIENPGKPPPTLEEAKATLANNPHVSWAYNQLARVQLEQGDLDAAQQTLQNAGLAYVNSAADSIETQWLWSEFHAKSGNLEKAIETGNNAINRYNSYGVYGPGSFGVLQYAPRVFRMNAMAMEIVLQMIILTEQTKIEEWGTIVNQWQVLKSEDEK